ncbi:MAG: hypothetical protein ACOVMN_11275, partial [Flexibacteraceae bacterium]
MEEKVATNFHDEEEDAFLALLLDKGLKATAQASKEAEKSGITMVIAEDGGLYNIYQNGKRELIQTINQSSKKYPRKFKL